MAKDKVNEFNLKHSWEIKWEFHVLITFNFLIIYEYTFVHIKHLSLLSVRQPSITDDHCGHQRNEVEKKYNYYNLTVRSPGILSCELN